MALGSPSGGRQTHIALFRELSEEVLRMFVFLSESPTEVRLTPEQWEEHTQRFSGTLREVVSEEDDSQGAIVYRHGLIAARIAMVLTAMRKCEPMWNVPECYCTDEDFHTAMDMAAVLLDHSLLLSTSFQNAQKGRRGRPMKKFYRIRSVLAEMPDRFTFSELLAVALIHGIPATTLKRYLVRLIEMDILVKEGNMYCKTFKPWPKNPK